MDSYQRVGKSRPETPIDENEIRITTKGRIRNYITYATSLLEKENGPDEIVFKSMGKAIWKTVMIAELVKRRIVGLHQITSLGSIDIVDTWEPKEKGLEMLETNRHVSIITITLSKYEPDMSSIGYQDPIPKEQVKPLAEVNLGGGRGRGGRSRGRARGNVAAPVEYVSVSDNRGRGYGRGGGRGSGHRVRGRGGYGGQFDYQQGANFFDAPLPHYPMQGRVGGYQGGGGKGGYGDQFNYQQPMGYFDAPPYPMQGRGSFDAPPYLMQGRGGFDAPPYLMQGLGRGRGNGRGRGRGFRANGLYHGDQLV